MPLQVMMAECSLLLLTYSSETNMIHKRRQGIIISDMFDTNQSCSIVVKPVDDTTYFVPW